MGTKRPISLVYIKFVKVSHEFGIFIFNAQQKLTFLIDSEAEFKEFEPRLKFETLLKYG